MGNEWAIHFILSKKQSPLQASTLSDNAAQNSPIRHFHKKWGIALNPISSI